MAKNKLILIIKNKITIIKSSIEILLFFNLMCIEFIYKKLSVQPALEQGEYIQ